jgi:uncharacterized membrane protein YqjE
MADPVHQTGFQAAIEDLTDGLSTLVSRHFDLVRVEARREASEVGKNAAIIGVMLAIGMIGYGIFLLGVVLLVGWLAGTGPMAWTALGLGLFHLLLAAVATRGALLRLREGDSPLPETKEELHRSREWLKEIREQSSPGLPAETN